MWIRILHQTSINGRTVRIGDVVEAAPVDARLLMAMGKAEAAPEPDPVVCKPRIRKPNPKETNGRS